MVAHKWKDTQIHERIEFAKREACIRANMTYDWPASSRAIQEWIDSARRRGWTRRTRKGAAGRIAAAQWLIEQHGGHEQCR